MSELVTITVDGREFEVKPGELIIKAAEDNGTYIPRFCWHPRMNPVGMCRMCLVEVETPRGPMMITACTNPVSEGMAVDTQSDAVKKAQEGVLEFLLANHPLDCPVCDKGGECPLQDQAMAYGPGESRFVEIKRKFEKPIPISDLVLLDRERCILCARCTRFSDEISGDPLIEFKDRGNETQINTFPDHPFSSYFSGNTVQICPVGALTAKSYRFRARPWDLNTVESSSLLDTAHPRISIHASQNEVLRVIGVDSEPVNHGWLSDKDRFSFAAYDSEDRLTTPLIRKSNGSFRPASWAEALDHVATRLGEIKDTGGRIAVLGGARGTNEDAYALSKFARTVLAATDIDCQMDDGLAPGLLAAVVDRARIADLESARTVLVWGPDLKETHPTLYLRVRRAAQELGATLIIAHPRATGLDDRASIKLGYRPGQGFDLLASVMGGEHPDVVEALGAGPVVALVGRCGYAEDPRLAEAVAAFVRVAGKDAKVLPLAHRGNVYGALDMGLAPELLPGRAPLDSVHCANLAESWGPFPDKQGRGAAGIIEALADGSTAALLLVGADPVADMPGGAAAADALESAGLVVSVDLFINSSNRAADVILPATGFAEKEGTVTNLEGRVQKLNRVVPGPGLARPDWEIFDDLSSRMGSPLGFSSAEAISKEIEATAPAYAEITWDRLEWDDRDGVIIDLQSQPLKYVPAALESNRKVDAEFLLHSARTMYDAGVTLTHAPLLAALAPGSAVHLNPVDAKRLGAQQGATVRMVTKSAEAELSAVLDDATPEGVVYVPFNQPEGFSLGADPIVRLKTVT